MDSEKKPRGRPKGIHTPTKYFTEEERKTLNDHQRVDI